MEELSTDIAVVTETWFQDSQVVSDTIEDFRNKNGVGCIRRDRRTGARDGGVAIFYDETKIEMTRARIPHSKHEVVAAIGRRAGQRRKVLTIATYIPTWYNAAQNSSLYNYINDYHFAPK